MSKSSTKPTPTIECKNCGCMRRTPCYCKAKKAKTAKAANTEAEKEAGR